MVGRSPVGHKLTGENAHALKITTFLALSFSEVDLLCRVAKYCMLLIGNSFFTISRNTFIGMPV